jgi:hypothetical protein
MVNVSNKPFILSIFVHYAVMLSVVMLSVIILNVMAPLQPNYCMSTTMAYYLI